MNFKKEGFDGQRAIVIPRPVLARSCERNEVISGAYITDIGYYPKAKGHLRERSAGSMQNILLYCVEGKGEVMISGAMYELSPGEFMLIPNNTTHTYKADEHHPWTIYWCHFMGRQANALVKMFCAKESSNKGAVVFMDERIKLFEQMCYFLEQGYSSENITYVNLMLLQFLGSFIYGDKYGIDPAASADERLERSIVFMKNNIDKALTLADLSASVNLSNSQYSKLFKARTGFAPHEYFNHLKIQKACQFLQFTGLRIQEISLKIGIQDAFYFSRLFTKTMGYGPKEYRDSRYRREAITSNEDV